MLLLAAKGLLHQSMTYVQANFLGRGRGGGVGKFYQKPVSRRLFAMCSFRNY